MSLLEALVHTSLAEGLGWTLLHSLWEGAFVAAVLATVLWATKSPRVRYAASCLAMLAILCGFGITLALVMPGESQFPRSVELPGYVVLNGRTGAEFPGVSNAGFAAVVPWLAPFWILGVSLFYLRHMAGWFSVCRLRRRGVCAAPDRWHTELARLCAMLRVSRPVRLLESCLTEAPVVLGHFRPVILMPVGLLAGLPTGQVEAVLLHELAHIRRCDYLVNLFQRAVEGLLFYHPAIWWITRVIRTERENCCDDVAVAVSGDAHAYAVALAALEQNRWSSREPAIAATGGNIVKRIRRLLYREGSSGAWAPMSAIVILIAISAAVLSAWQTDPPQQSRAVPQHNTSLDETPIPSAQQSSPPHPRPAAVQRKTSLAESSPYSKWLNEDVVYIISRDERSAFLKLATDEEREKFVEQFWLRRDPNPETAVNEFKEEHYRRIAYANLRYATSNKPGWMTDRGRTYIHLGPPDQIESHPSRAAGFPFEIWTYHHIKGLVENYSMKFEDLTLTGDYELAPNLYYFVIREKGGSSAKSPKDDK